jgi:hypothetical protein
MSGDDFRVPKTLVVGVVMYIITSIPAAVYFMADVQARLHAVEVETDNVPSRLAILETRLNDVTNVLKEIRDELRKN